MHSWVGFGAIVLIAMMPLGVLLWSVPELIRILRRPPAPLDQPDKSAMRYPAAADQETDETVTVEIKPLRVGLTRLTDWPVITRLQPGMQIKYEGITYEVLEGALRIANFKEGARESWRFPLSDGETKTQCWLDVESVSDNDIDRAIVRFCKVIPDFPLIKDAPPERIRWNMRTFSRKTVRVRRYRSHVPQYDWNQMLCVMDQVVYLRMSTTPELDVDYTLIAERSEGEPWVMVLAYVVQEDELTVTE